MKNIRVIVCIIALLQALIGLGQKVLAVDSFELQLKKQPNAQLIDVRTPDEFARGYLPGAVNYNFYDTDFSDKLNKLDRTQPVYVYCAAGGRSGSAASRLVGLGFKEVYDLRGGYLAWTNAKKAVELPVAKATTGDSLLVAGDMTAGAVTTNVKGGMDKAALLKLIADNKFTVVDFHAKWCGPCKVMAPVLEDIKKQMGDKLTLVKIDVDENPTLADELNIEALPTLFYYNGSRFLGKTLGYNGKADLQSKIDSFSKLAK